jgi:hypothetical protein
MLVGAIGSQDGGIAFHYPCIFSNCFVITIPVWNIANSSLPILLLLLVVLSLHRLEMPYIYASDGIDLISKKKSPQAII